MARAPKIKPADTLVLTGGRMAKLLGISERRVREIKDQGKIESLPTGQYDAWTVVPQYCAMLRPAAGRAAEGGADNAESLDEARRDLILEQTKRQRLNNAMLSGASVTAEDLQAVVGAIFGGVRTKALAFPSTAAARLQGVTDKHETLEVLTELMHAMLSGLATTEVVASVHDRARKRAGRDNDAVGEEAAVDE